MTRAGDPEISMTTRAELEISRLSVKREYSVKVVNDLHTLLEHDSPPSRTINVHQVLRITYLFFPRNRNIFSREQSRHASATSIACAMYGYITKLPNFRLFFPIKHFSIRVMHSAFRLRKLLL